MFDRVHPIQLSFQSRRSDSGVLKFLIFSALSQVVWLSEKILMEHAENISGNTEPLYKALVLCMISGRPTKTKIQSILQRMFSSLQGTSIATALLDQITDMLIRNKVQVSNIILPSCYPLQYSKSLSLYFLLFNIMNIFNLNVIWQ